MSFFLGIDVSTTATKALLLDSKGSTIGVATAPHDLSMPRPLWAEQDPQQWWEATCRSVGQLIAESGVAPAAVAAIGLTGQMHGLVLLDDAGSVLRPAILWNDQRAAAECDEIRRRVGRAELVRLTGNDAFAGLSAPKLLWVRQHEPEVYRRIRHVLLPKDYIRFRLTDGFATDRAGAGGTLFLDLQRRDWSAAVLAALEVPAEWLPPTHEGTQVTGLVSDAASGLTGLRAGTPVVAGAGDQAAQAVGVGVVESGIVALTLGTSGVVFAACETPLTEPEGRLHAFPHAVADRWHVMGVMLSAAGSLRWFRDSFAPETDYDALLDGAASVEPGCEGLLFLPYLSGERTPHADPQARGAFVGLTLRHSRPHLTRAVLEGVGFGLRDNLLMMRHIGLADVTEARISGGGAESPLWRQLLADILGVDLLAVQTPEAAALGAALLAGVGVGAWSTVSSACAAAVQLGALTRPRGSVRACYEHVYGVFRQAYPALQPLFRELSTCPS